MDRLKEFLFLFFLFLWFFSVQGGAASGVMNEPVGEGRCLNYEDLSSRKGYLLPKITSFVKFKLCSFVTTHVQSTREGNNLTHICLSVKTQDGGEPHPTDRGVLHPS